MVELRQAEDLAHRLEDYLRVLRQGDAILTAEGIDALFDGTQMLEQVVGVRRSGGTLPGGRSGRGAHRAAGRRCARRGRRERRTVRRRLPPAAVAARGAARSRRRRIWSRAASASTRSASGCRAAGEILDAVPRVTGDGCDRVRLRARRARSTRRPSRRGATDGIEVERDRRTKTPAPVAAPRRSSRPSSEATSPGAAARRRTSCASISRASTS